MSTNWWKFDLRITFYVEWMRVMIGNIHWWDLLATGMEGKPPGGLMQLIEV